MPDPCQAASPHHTPLTVLKHLCTRRTICVGVKAQERVSASLAQSLQGRAVLNEHVGERRERQLVRLTVEQTALVQDCLPLTGRSAGGIPSIRLRSIKPFRVVLIQGINQHRLSGCVEQCYDAAHISAARVAPRQRPVQVRCIVIDAPPLTPVVVDDLPVLFQEVRAHGPICRVIQGVRPPPQRDIVTSAEDIKRSAQIGQVLFVAGQNRADGGVVEDYSYRRSVSPIRAAMGNLTLCEKRLIILGEPSTTNFSEDLKPVPILLCEGTHVSASGLSDNRPMGEHAARHCAEVLLTSSATTGNKARRQ